MTCHAAIVGFSEMPAQPYSRPVAGTGLELAFELIVDALQDAGLDQTDLDGVCVTGLHESDSFAPATLTEYIGRTVTCADAPDLGGASPVAMIGRAALFINAGMADTVVCVIPGRWQPASADGLDWRHLGASSYNPGSPQAEFEIPYGHLGQNVPYAMIAQRYAHEYGYDEVAMAQIVVDQRKSACANSAAIFHGQPLTIDDVLDSRMIATPLRMLEIVRPVTGGTAVVVASAATQKRCRHRPVRIAGYGEAITHKSPHYARDMLRPPMEAAAHRAFAMASRKPGEMQSVQLYDCYTISVLLQLEAAGFAPFGKGQPFIRERCLSYDGDFPVNTNGGQLGFGQAALAGGMTHVIEAASQIMGRAGERQIQACNTNFVGGNGGIMSEQVALVLEGAG